MIEVVVGYASVNMSRGWPRGVASGAKQSCPGGLIYGRSFFNRLLVVYVSAGRVLSPVCSLESCDLETVSTRDG